jgi:hypothetical protein
MTETKQLDWSYPTSGNASRLGFAATGCWTVSVSRDGAPADAVKGFASRDEAIAFARSLPMPFGYLWRHLAA